MRRRKEKMSPKKATQKMNTPAMWKNSKLGAKISGMAAPAVV